MATATHYLLVAAVSMVVILTIANAIRSYRRLSHIPGPRLATVSRLWHLSSLSGPRNHLNLFEANLKYGPLVRIGPNHLVTSDPELIRRMKAPRSPYRRGPWFDAMRFKPGKDNVISERQEEEHERLRKMMAPGYAGKENPHLESDIDERIRDLISLIERKYICTDKERGRQMDFAQKVQFLTLDVISALAFDRPFGDLVADQDNYEYIKSVEEALPTIICMTELPEVRSFLEKSSLMNWLAPSARDKIGLGKIIAIANEKVAERFGDDRKVRQDMLGSFLKHGLSQEEAESEAVLQLFAGSDTAATAIRATILFITTTPRVLWRLTAEIDGAVSSDSISSPIKDSEARALPYLQACIKESLRLFPPVTGTFDMMVPPEGDTFNGLFLPGGTEIGVSQWAVQRSMTLFGPDAIVFRPERWLDVPDAQLQRMERNNELIFGYGRSKCLGQSIALMELNKVFVELLRRYEITLIDPSNPWKSVNKGTFMQTDMWVRITRRGGVTD